MLRIANRRFKAEVIDKLRDLLHAAMFPHLDTAVRSTIMDHIEWMKRQREELKVKVEFQTVPELRLTRVTFELWFEGGPSETNH